MKASFLVITLVLSIQSAFAEKLCNALSIIKKNESVIASLNPEADLEKLDVYKETRAAYETIITESMIAGKTNSVKRFVAKSWYCQDNSPILTKQLTNEEIKEYWTPEEYEQLIEKLSKNRTFGDVGIHLASQTLTFAATGITIVALLAGSEVVAPVAVVVALAGGATLSTNWLVNRSPSFIKRINLKYFDKTTNEEINRSAASLADATLKEIINQSSTNIKLSEVNDDSRNVDLDSKRTYQSQDNKVSNSSASPM